MCYWFRNCPQYTEGRERRERQTIQMSRLTGVTNKGTNIQTYEVNLSHKMSRSSHLHTRILKFYVAILTRFIMYTVQMVSAKLSSLKAESLKLLAVKTVGRTHIPRMGDGVRSLRLSDCFPPACRSTGSDVFSMTSSNFCLWSFLLKWEVGQKRSLSGLSGYNYI